MEQAQHTQGPWYVSMGTSVFKDIGDDAHLIASCDDWSEETKANARLIAAAPDLLEACLAMIEWDAREKDHAIDFMARIALCEGAFEKARAAIARATLGE